MLWKKTKGKIEKLTVNLNTEEKISLKAHLYRMYKTISVKKLSHKNYI